MSKSIHKTDKVGFNEWNNLPLKVCTFYRSTTALQTLYVPVFYFRN